MELGPVFPLAVLKSCCSESPFLIKLVVMTPNRGVALRSPRPKFSGGQKEKRADFLVALHLI